MINVASKIQLPKGLLVDATFSPSPHCDKRPENSSISLLVIHNISLPPGEFQGEAVKQFFLNELDFSAHPYFQQLKNLKVSAHLFIRRDGSIIQFVPFSLRAWHAGVSSFQGESHCNNFSIGIELEGTDTIPYTELQYQQLSQVTSSIMQCYPKITCDRIVGHDIIAPKRKTDPGPAFEWTYFFNLMAETAS